MGQKIVGIESQNVDSDKSAKELIDTLIKAKSKGYTHVQDYWGHNAWDEYTIDEAIEKFTIKTLK